MKYRFFKNTYFFFKPPVKSRANVSVCVFCRDWWATGETLGRSTRCDGEAGGVSVTFWLFFPFKVVTDLPGLKGIWGDKVNRTFGDGLWGYFRTYSVWGSREPPEIPLGAPRTIRRANLSSPQRTRAGPSLGPWGDAPSGSLLATINHFWKGVADRKLSTRTSTNKLPRN